MATHAPRFDDYRAYLTWQEGRVARAGVRLRLDRRADADRVADYGADAVVVATGGRPRMPGIPGEDLPFVHTAVDVLTGRAETGRRVLVVAQDDHLAPLAVADFLGERGAAVTLVHGTTSPAPLVSRYLIGSALARLDRQGAVFRFSEQVVAIQEGRVQVRHVYSHLTRTIEDVDTVVLACGAVPENGLFDELTARGIPAHVLGDAFAPRRLAWATRQAYELAAIL